MKDKNLEKTVLVTGSTRGIGRAIAEAFHADGAQVGFNGRNRELVDEAISGRPRTVACPGDVSDPKIASRVVDRLLNEFGRLDVLVCNVGGGHSVPPGSESFEEWQRMFSLNLWSTTNMVEAARPLLARSNGSIVCVSSICGDEVIEGAPVTYSAAKAALNAYVRGIARPLGREGIRINAVAPGNILFDGSVWAEKLGDNPDGVQRMLDAETSLARLGTPDEVANTVLFVASTTAAFATGSVWTLDGGQRRTN